MKRHFFGWKKIIWVIVILAIGLGGWLGYKRYKSGKNKGAEPENLAAVTRGDIQLKFQDAGEVTPKNPVDIASPATGRITELFVEEGGRVRSGDKIAVIQPGKSESEKYVPVTITAPMDGIIMKYTDDTQNGKSYFAKAGDRVNGLYDYGSPTYLMRVADLKKLIVKMKISEMDILKLNEGMKVDITIDALAGTPFIGMVSLISPQAEKDNTGVKMFTIEVSLSKTHPGLRPGMTARVEAVLDSRKNAVKIPLSALFEETNETFVYLASGPGKKPQKTAVKAGLRSETDIEILSGLKENDKVFTEKPPDETKK